MLESPGFAERAGPFQSHPRYRDRTATATADRLSTATATTPQRGARVGRARTMTALRTAFATATAQRPPQHRYRHRRFLVPRGRSLRSLSQDRAHARCASPPRPPRASNNRTNRTRAEGIPRDSPTTRARTGPPAHPGRRASRGARAKLSLTAGLPVPRAALSAGRFAELRRSTAPPSSSLLLARAPNLTPW